MPLRPPARTFRDLIVWQKAHALALGVYKLTATFPKNEVYGLTAQMRTAAVSVPANVVEGFRRSSRPDKARMLNVAQGSLEELRYYLILTEDLGLGDPSTLMAQLEEVSRLLDAYRKSLLTPPDP